jgi:colanic acid/amylovoran biosynthesis glycosyltransferase
VKVAFLVGVFPKLSETFILNQIAGLIDRGHDVTILAMEPGENEHHDDVTRYDLLNRTEYRDPLQHSLAGRLTNAAVEWARRARISPHRGAMSAALSFPISSPRLQLLMVSKMLRGRRFDIMHCHFGYMGKMAARIAATRLFEWPFLTSYHGSDLDFGLRAEEYQQLHRYCPLFTTNSEFSKRRAIELGCPEDRLSLLPVGVNLEHFRFAERRLGADGMVRAISVARLTENKGLAVAIEAVRLLAKTGLHIRLEIIGDGPMRKELEQKALDCGVRDLVVFYGAQIQREVRRRLSEAHIFVLPTLGVEGQGLVLQEAQAAGLPVVASNCGGIPEGILDGDSGYLFPAGDSQALADRIQLLAARHLDWPQMGRAGRRFVEAKYDIERLNDRLVDLYANVCAKHPRSSNG